MNIKHTHISAIQYAAKNGHINVVKLLLSDQKVDPSDNNNEGKWFWDWIQKIQRYIQFFPFFICNWFWDWIIHPHTTCTQHFVMPNPIITQRLWNYYWQMIESKKKWTDLQIVWFNEFEKQYENIYSLDFWRERRGGGKIWRKYWFNWIELKRSITDTIYCFNEY